MNYEFKGTPGPWKVGFAVDHNAVAVWPRIKHPDENGYSDTICLISPELDITETDTHNSNLIAAAPDLLDLAKLYLADMKALVPESAARNNRIEIIEQVLQKALNINQ